jgi:hypothetical protein
LKILAVSAQQDSFAAYHFASAKVNSPAWLASEILALLQQPASTFFST